MGGEPILLGRMMPGETGKRPKPRADELIIGLGVRFRSVVRRLDRRRWRGVEKSTGSDGASDSESEVGASVSTTLSAVERPAGSGAIVGAASGTEVGGSFSTANSVVGMSTASDADADSESEEVPLCPL